jgi:hypothetical protein
MGQRARGFTLHWRFKVFQKKHLAFSSLAVEESEGISYRFQQRAFCTSFSVNQG